MTEAMKSQLELLKIEIPYLAREIVNRQYEIQPEFEKYGTAGRRHALTDAGYNLEYLFSAIEVDSVALFVEYTCWTNRLFLNLGLPSSTLLQFYECAKDTFKHRMASDSNNHSLYSKLSTYVDFGIEAIQSNQQPLQATLEENPMQSILNKYSEAVLSGDKHGAISLIKETADQGEALAQIYKYVLQPFQLELGNLWYHNKINVAQEHYATAVTQFAMSSLYEKIFATPKTGKVLLGTCAHGELHELGIRMVCDYMESRGWNTHYLGANMPEQAVRQMVLDLKPDVVAISCTMLYNIGKLIKMIQAIRGMDVPVKILVGGYPFKIDLELWHKVGADASALDFKETLTISEKWFGEGRNEV